MHGVFFGKSRSELKGNAAKHPALLAPGLFLSVKAGTLLRKITAVLPGSAMISALLSGKIPPRIPIPAAIPGLKA